MLKPFYVIPRIGGLAYLNNPKAACSSVLLALSQMRLDKDFEPPKELLNDGSHPIHGFYPPYAHMEFFFRRWPLSFPALPDSFVTFSFVRNPYARFYSFYKSKVVCGQAPIQYYEKFGIRKGCSFEECVQIITSVDPQKLEHHVAPQTMLLSGKGRLQADFIGKVEEISEDWQVINDLTGFNLQLEHVNVTKSSGQSVYCAETKKRIFDYYRNDFDLFGYEKDSIALTDDVPSQSGKSVYSEHLLSVKIINELRNELSASGGKIRQLAIEFKQDANRREDFFKYQEESFRELLLKIIFRNEEQIREINEEQIREINEEQIREINEKKTREINRYQSLLQEKEKRIAQQLDSLRKFNISYKDKLSESTKQLNLLKQSQELLGKKQEELERTRNILYMHTLATYRSARKNPLKKICRFRKLQELNEAKFLRNSGLVDPSYYFENYPYAIAEGMTAAEHYVRYGAQQGNNPSAQFNTKQYLVDNPDVAHEGVNPLVHFALNG